MTDRAIAWIRQQKALIGDKPFFAYFAPGATHAPHHVPPEWSTRYNGKFDQGWTGCARRRSRGRSGSASSRPTRS
jgi:arylsulfatase A-like enzyme